MSDKKLTAILSKARPLLCLQLATLLLSVVCATLWVDAQGDIPTSQTSRVDLEPIQHCSLLSPADGHLYNQIYIQRVADQPGFSIDAHEVTNAQFAAFVAATDYLTVAEQQLNPADYPGIEPARLVPGSAVFSAPKTLVGDDIHQWWKFVAGASWQHPLGPGSDIEGREHYPVVHIAYQDALAYAEWARRELPTEQQWQLAASSGESPTRSVWHQSPTGEASANIWHGNFPLANTADDGFAGVAPVGCFPASVAGLHDMIGNTWEWVVDPYQAVQKRVPRISQQAESATSPNTLGRNSAGDSELGLIKGGSFLCSGDFCANYTPEARMPQERSMSSNHLGFRTVSRSRTTRQ